LCLRDRHVGENTAEHKRRKNRPDKKSKLHRASKACHAFHLFEELAPMPDSVRTLGRRSNVFDAPEC
jgi:hypothetical protein